MNWGFALWYLPVFVVIFVAVMPFAVREMDCESAEDYAMTSFMVAIVAFLWIVVVPAVLLFLAAAEIGRRFDKRTSKDLPR